MVVRLSRSCRRQADYSRPMYRPPPASTLLFVRKIVLTTGSGGMGDWTIPETLRHLPSSICVHTAQPIDFASLRGKQIAVIGAGALGVRQCRDRTGGRRGGGASVLPQGGHPGDPALPLAHLSLLPAPFL